MGRELPADPELARARTARRQRLARSKPCRLCGLPILPHETTPPNNKRVHRFCLDTQDDAIT